MILSAKLCTRLDFAITETNGITIIQTPGIAIANVFGFTANVQHSPNDF